MNNGKNANSSSPFLSSSLLIIILFFVFFVSILFTALSNYALIMIAVASSAVVLDLLKGKVSEFEKNNASRRVLAKVGVFYFFKTIRSVSALLALSLAILCCFVVCGGVVSSHIALTCLFFGLVLLPKCWRADFLPQESKDIVAYLSLGVFWFFVGKFYLVGFSVLLSVQLFITGLASVFANLNSSSYLPAKDYKHFSKASRWLAFIAMGCFVFNGLMWLQFSLISAVALAGILPFFCLKKYFVSESSAEVGFNVSEDDKKKDKGILAEYADKWNVNSLLYELFYLWHPLLVGLSITGLPALFSFSGVVYALLSIGLVADTLTLGALLGGEKDKETESSSNNISNYPELFKWLGALSIKNVADFFQKRTRWTVILAIFPISWYWKMMAICLCTAISVVSGLTRQFASLSDKKLTEGFNERLKAEYFDSKDPIKQKEHYVSGFCLLTAVVLVNQLWLQVFSLPIWVLGLFIATVVVALFEALSDPDTDEERQRRQSEEKEKKRRQSEGKEKKGVFRACVLATTSLSMWFSTVCILNQLFLSLGVSFVFYEILPLSIVLAGVGATVLLFNYLKSIFNILSDYKHFAYKIAFLSGMLKTFTGCFRSLLPYLGIGGGSIALVEYFSLSTSVVLGLGFVLIISQILEGYLFSKHVLLQVAFEQSSTQKDVKKSQSEFIYRFAPLVLATVILPFVFIYSVITLKVAVIIGTAIGVISSAQYLVMTDDARGKGFLWSVVAVCLVGANVALVAWICSMLVASLQIAAIQNIFIGNAVLGLAASLILLYPYYTEIFDYVKSPMMKLIFTKICRVFIWASFISRLGGALLTAQIFLYQIPALASFGLLVNVLAVIISISFMAQYGINAGRFLWKMDEENLVEVPPEADRFKSQDHCSSFQKGAGEKEDVAQNHPLTDAADQKKKVIDTTGFHSIVPGSLALPLSPSSSDAVRPAEIDAVTSGLNVGTPPGGGQGSQCYSSSSSSSDEETSSLPRSDLAPNPILARTLSLPLPGSQNAVQSRSRAWSYPGTSLRSIDSWRKMVRPQVAVNCC